jgi:hypothetical protein
MEIETYVNLQQLAPSSAARRLLSSRLCRAGAARRPSANSGTQPCLMQSASDGTPPPAADVMAALGAATVITRQRVRGVAYRAVAEC